MTTLTLEALKKQSDEKQAVRETIKIGDLEAKCRRLTSVQCAEIEASLTDINGNQTEATLAAYQAKIVAASTVDDSDNRIFKSSDLTGMDGAIVAELFAQAYVKSGYADYMQARNESNLGNSESDSNETTD